MGRAMHCSVLWERAKPHCCAGKHYVMLALRGSLVVPGRVRTAWQTMGKAAKGECPSRSGTQLS